MTNIINKKMKKRKGFTLVELVVVVAILGILAAVAIPKLTTSRTSAANSAHNSNVSVLQSAASMYMAEEGMPTAEVTWDQDAKDGTDGWGPYLQKWPDVPKGAKTKDGTGIDSEVYKVTIKTDGTVEVTPESIDLDAE